LTNRKPVRRPREFARFTSHVFNESEVFNTIKITRTSFYGLTDFDQGWKIARKT